MISSEYIAEQCRNEGYDQVHVKSGCPSYRGSTMPLKERIIVKDNDIHMIAISDYRERLQGIRRVQSQIPEAAQIFKIIPGSGEFDIALIEYIDDSLLWELEEGSRPPLDIVVDSLDKLVTNLASADLVHADIRPWNLFYESKTSSLRCIDWGFSFFVGGRKYDNTEEHLRQRGHLNRDEREIDREDADRTIRVLRSPDSLEREWVHGSGKQVTWRPSPWL